MYAVLEIYRRYFAQQKQACSMSSLYVLVPTGPLLFYFAPFQHQGGEHWVAIPPGIQATIFTISLLHPLHPGKGNSYHINNISHCPTSTQVCLPSSDWRRCHPFWVFFWKDISTKIHQTSKILEFPNLFKKFPSGILRKQIRNSQIESISIAIWVFPNIGVGPQNAWFIMENPIKMGWFGGTPIFGNIHIYVHLYSCGTPWGHVAAVPSAMRSVSSWQLLISRTSVGFPPVVALKTNGGWGVIFVRDWRLVLLKNGLGFFSVFFGCFIWYLVLNEKCVWKKQLLGGGVGWFETFCDPCRCETWGEAYLDWKACLVEMGSSNQQLDRPGQPWVQFKMLWNLTDVCLLMCLLSYDRDVMFFKFLE